MATTIKSTALDFQAIKNNLKEYLEQEKEFKDFNFEASGLSNVLDVLAYNTHMNALTANFALNEAFLGTAQLRSSLVSLSEGIGYIPDSRNGSLAQIKMSLNLSGISNPSPRLSLSAGYKFASSVDEVDYTFQTTETITASNDGCGVYEFKLDNGSNIIPIKEGISKTKTFISGDNTENITYIIPDKNLDLSTAVVKVYPHPTSDEFTSYSNILETTVINENTTIYILKEMPNGYFELTFGNGTTLGKTPLPGNKIVVEYLSVAGEDANFASVFEPVSAIANVAPQVNQVPTVTTESRSSGGADKESTESIRKNAPFQYASQNRMVTHADYSSLVLRNFSSLIKDIKSWGGEDNIVKQYGCVYMSVLFNSDIPQATVDATKTSILDLAEQLAIASFDLKFSDPVKTFVELDTKFQFNERLTSLTLNTIKSQVEDVIRNYFIENTGKFDLAFRRSNLLTLMDDVSTAVLSSRTDVKMQQRITPILGGKYDYKLKFPVDIAVQDDDEYIISSTNFTLAGVNCKIQNKLSSNTLQVINLQDNRVIADDVGYYTTDGNIHLVGLQVDSLIAGQTQIKISAVTANQSAIVPTRNDVLEYDESASKVTGVLTTATN